MFGSKAPNSSVSHLYAPVSLKDNDNFIDIEDTPRYHICNCAYQRFILIFIFSIPLLLLVFIFLDIGDFSFPSNPTQMGTPTIPNCDIPALIISDSDSHSILDLFKDSQFCGQLSPPIFVTNQTNYQELYSPEYIKFLSENQWIRTGKEMHDCGITKAHINSCLSIVEQTDHYGLIFEEDAFANPNFKREEVLKLIPRHIQDLEKYDKNWDMLLVGYCAWKHLEPDAIEITKFIHKPGKEIRVTCAHAYAISVNGAKKYATWHNGLSADMYFQALYRMDIMNIYYLKLPLFVQLWQFYVRRPWLPDYFGGPLGPIHCVEKCDVAQTCVSDSDCSLIASSRCLSGTCTNYTGDMFRKKHWRTVTSFNKDLIDYSNYIVKTCAPDSVDHSGNSCKHWKDNGWCTVWGQYGSGWNQKRNKFTDHMIEVCPDCGICHL